MKFSFKKFVELVDQEADLTEEQLDEIFGVFATHDEKQKKIAAQKKAEFDERRKALQAKQRVNPKAGTRDEMDDARDPNDPRKVPAIQPKNQQGPRLNNAQGRKAEMDWHAQFEAADKVFFGPANTGRKLAQYAKTKNTAEALMSYGDFSGSAVKVELTFEKPAKNKDVEAAFKKVYKKDFDHDEDTHARRVAEDGKVRSALKSAGFDAYMDRSVLENSSPLQVVVFDKSQAKVQVK